MDVNNIKFKAKRLDNGEWVKGDLVHSYNDGVVIFPIEGCAQLVDPSSVCQYTGLKDENGKEVWEHDILESPHFKGEVVFSKGYYRVQKDDCVSFSFPFFNIIAGKIDYCRVIGNKFDEKEAEDD